MKKTQNKKRFFGTDGIRGIANHDLTPELVLRLGRALVHVLQGKSNSKFLIGKDPRLSSDMLEGALVAGLISAGGTVVSCGILPTPAISYLTRSLKFTAGIMISASHNPVEHNGIKIFSQDGLKLSDEKEEEIENLLNGKEDKLARPLGTSLGRLEQFPHGVEKYEAFLKSAFPNSLSGIRLVVDCAYGATSEIAPLLFEFLGANVIPICSIPDGARINVNCGATDLRLLQEAVLKEKADLGIAFDGDGDRAMFVTSNGKVFHGDHTLAALALHFKKKGVLRAPVVATVMSNFGLEEVLQNAGIPLVRTRVGDRYVLEEMLRLNASLGGEQSGHIILLDQSAAGDGILTALQILNLLVETGKTLEELRGLVREFPQILVNVPVRRKGALDEDEEIKNAIQREESRLEGRGRIVVRPSGTEPLVRVMAEGPDEKELQDVVGRVVEVVERRLN